MSKKPQLPDLGPGGLRLVSVEVSELFGAFDHKIPLNLDERITILHGPNGVGKTILLMMIHGLLSGVHTVFRRVPFRKFRLRFLDGRVLVLHKANGRKAKHLESVDLSVQLLNERGDILGASQPLFTQKERTLQRVLLESIERRVPFLHRLGPARWLDERTGQHWTSEDVLEIYGHRLLPSSFQAEDPSRDSADWLTQLRHALSVRLIDTQRLQALDTDWMGERPTPGRTVEALSSDLARRIQEVLAEYAARAQELDRTFPNRLFTGSSETALSVENLKAKLAKLERKREELTQLGFLDKEQAPPQAPANVVKDRADVLSIYVADMERKLGVFDSMAARISLLTQTINRRFRYKKLSVSREQGFLLTSDDGTNLSPTDLSSGEQHELVLLYELLFRLKPNSLVLIDEPELSLHVAWQESVLSDLEKIVKLSQVDILIATHSPEIIGERWDLTVGLQAPLDPDVK